MDTYTVSVAFYDAWNVQTLVTKGASPLKAGEAAIRLADGKRVDHYKLESWDPSATFVAGIRPGGKLSDNKFNLDPVLQGPVPYRLSEEFIAGSPCSRVTAQELVEALTMLRLWAVDEIGSASKCGRLPEDHPIKRAASALQTAKQEGLTP
ncbi:hypothetical protein IC232_03255 [Microvirga sp. BT688]|uniref:hypothetical protein n=1 Tax=Microvirga sp. TaxID=1873136 RepID=UPI0016881270|nr:hypothetical protein [Microvirga sp.]MBD2745706.1 hypothetical protein [Microvirga sp.]